MSRLSKTRNLKKAMLEALEQNLGNVTNAAKLVGIARRTHYDWTEDDPKYKADVESVGEMAIDFVESALFRQIRDGQPASTIFFLKTRAKHRGYIERNELALSGSMEIRKLSWFDPEQDEAMYKLLSEQTIPQKNGN